MMERILSINEFLEQPKGLNLAYGNPQKWQKEAMDKGSEIAEVMKNSPCWNEWMNTPPPQQDSIELKNALHEMCEMIPEDLQFLEDIEDDLYGTIAKECNSLGIEVTVEELEKIAESLDPITFSIKYHYNYPRPYQTAYALGIPLYPNLPTDASSPAYPSGHSIDSYMICGLMGRRKPIVAELLMNLAKKISDGRIIAGVHYPFDASFGKKIAEDILSTI
jgi:hypothetical protein